MARPIEMAVPRAVVVMGVSGSGKSAVAQALAERLGGEAVDADDLHSSEAVAKMRSGLPLDDDDRWPWLDRVGARLQQGVAGAEGRGTVVACSALRRRYRDRLRAACPGLCFVFLDGDGALIAARLRERRGHYMPPALLESQLRTLERPGADERDVLTVDIAPALSTVVERASAALAGMASGPASPPPTHSNIAS